MAGITLADAEAKLAMYLAAEEAVLTGQSYMIAGRQMVRADLSKIQRGIEIWDTRVNELTYRGARAITPRPR
jgi:hypothetical protein